MSNELPPIGHLLKSIATFDSLDFELGQKRAREVIADCIAWWDCEFTDFLEQYRQLDAHNRELMDEAASAARLMTAKDAELAACKSILADPRVRALFPPLPDGTVLSSCT